MLCIFPFDPKNVFKSIRKLQQMLKLVASEISAAMNTLSTKKPERFEMFLNWC